MKILAIETSCDDTGIAFLEATDRGNFKVLSNVVSSQAEIHKKYGGVYPAMAKREHQKNLVPVLINALKEADLLQKYNEFPLSKIEKIQEILEREPELFKKLIPFLKKYQKPDVDLISVTNGPGLEPCLWVGVNFAKALSYSWNIPIVPVNHIEGHILINCFGSEEIGFPAIALVVSGGHTQLLLIRGIGKYKILGETRDDAAGECFDKCAKILGLGYPGGPEIARLAKTDRATSSIKLPRPMINTNDYDFSFSGLKTAVLYTDRKIQKKNEKYKQEMASEIQQTIIDVLIKKTMKATKDYKVKTIIMGGGVSANKELRQQLEKRIKKEIPGAKHFFPQVNHSTDNALMTAVTGYFHKTKKVAWQKLRAEANLRIS